MLHTISIPRMHSLYILRNCWHMPPFKISHPLIVITWAHESPPNAILIDFVVFVAYSSGYIALLLHSPNFTRWCRHCHTGRHVGSQCSGQCLVWPVTVPPTIICHAACCVHGRTGCRCPASAAVHVGYAHPPHVPVMLLVQLNGGKSLCLTAWPVRPTDWRCRPSWSSLRAASCRYFSTLWTNVA